jgi:tRNA pseudouridine38-40 synthase
MAVVGPRFHPRFDALSRSYSYRAGLSGEAASPFHRRWCWTLGRPLDLPSLEEATSALIGDHSFRAFAKAGQEERGDRCIVTGAEWGVWDPLGVEFHISANRFLHHMVRYLVGTLAEIGMGRRPVGDIGRLLRGEAGVETSPPAPARGLFLTRVRYANGHYPTDIADADGLDTASRPADPGRGIFTTYESDLP